MPSRADTPPPATGRPSLPAQSNPTAPLRRGLNPLTDRSTQHPTRADKTVRRHLDQRRGAPSSLLVHSRVRRFQGATTDCPPAVHPNDGQLTRPTSTCAPQAPSSTRCFGAPSRNRTYDLRFRNAVETVSASHLESHLTCSASVISSSGLVEHQAVARGGWTSGWTAFAVERPVGRGFDEGVRTGRDRGSDEPQVTRRAIVALTDPAAV